MGGGTAGWMTAAGLAEKFKRPDLKIRLIESEQIGTVGVGEATLPHIRFFNQSLGINEAEFMKATHATFKLGIEFCDWGRLGDHYIHPFGDFGSPINSVEFYHYWLRYRLGNNAGRLSEYSYPVIAAEQGRFRFPDPDYSKIESTFGYAYQFDSSLYAKFLRRFAENKGVIRIEGKVVDTTQVPETGFISAVQLENGTQVNADLFIDCSGFRGVLIENALQTGYDDWTKWLPCDRAIAIPTETSGKILPFTRATARSAGWQWRIPLQHRVGNGLVYCSEFISDDEALEELTAHLDGPTLADPNRLYFKTGKRKKLWNKNVVSIGLSGGFLEPLESTSIYLIQEGITALLELFPDQSFAQSDEQEYNRRMDLHFDRVRDFLLLHYVATQREDTEMWRHFSNFKLPDSLQEKINAWLSRGYLLRYEFGAFLPPSWVAVMIGQNLIPQAFDPRAGRISDKDLASAVENMRADVIRAAKNTPDHFDFISSIGAAMEKSA